jgi:hypothetical protein
MRKARWRQRGRFVGFGMLCVASVFCGCARLVRRREAATAALKLVRRCCQVCCTFELSYF